MTVLEFVNLLKRRWILVLSITFVLSVLAYLYSSAQTPMYRATSQVYVSVQGASTTSDLLQASNFSIRQVKSYSELAKSPLVLDKVIDELGLDVSAGGLSGRVDVESPIDTAMINISVSDSSPELASQVVNSVAVSLADTVASIDGDGGVKAVITRNAGVPKAPYSPNYTLNLMFGFIAGLGLGLALALTLEVTNNRVRSKNDIDQYGIPMVGSVVFDQDAPVHPLIIQDSPYTLRSEAFRRLRTNLQFLDVEGGAQTITVTSAIPGEGKSTTAMNLAIALADAGSRVIIVDADLRRPTVGKIMALPEEVGLTTVLIGKASIDDVTQPWAHDNLSVMTCGAIPPNPSELLGSVAMTRVIEELKEKYDIVIFDTAPLVPVTDGAVLAKLTDGALLVVGTGTVNKHQVKEAIDALEKVGARILGIVANRVPVSKNKKKDQYGYYYGYTNRDFDGKKERRKGKKKHNKELQQPLVVEEIKPKVEKPKEPQVLTPDPVVEGHPWSGETVTGAIPTVTAKTATKAKEGKSSEQQDFSSLLKPRHAVTKD